MSLAEDIFKKHHEYYIKYGGVETILQQAGQSEQISADYQGRVLFELLQNAFDKAESKIAVEAVNNVLYIANDGEKFTYNANHDYENGGNKERLDFQSVCSISTSSKTDAKSIGNKGVGFKSVFSIAAEGYVNIHTKGVIVDQKLRQDENISFRLYESYNSPDQVNEIFDLELANYIREKIAKAQVERSERGIPGFYFPIKLENTNNRVNNYFKNGYVTVVEVPFTDQSLLNELYEEIKSVHFNFIRLKHDKDISIQFMNEEDSFIKEIEPSSLCFTADLNNQELLNLAKDAGVTLDKHNKVALTFNPDGEGLFYNYLPTKEKCPFRYFDFQADFRTTVDRKSIDFDTNSKIGRYNNYLLRGCIELLFSSLNNMLDTKERLDLNIVSINSTTVNGAFREFSWRTFIIDRSSGKSIYKPTRSVLKINDGHIDQWNHDNKLHFHIPSMLIANIANKQFSNNSHSDRVLFFKSIRTFIHAITNDYNRRYRPSEVFKKEFTHQLRENEVQFLPDVKVSRKSEILFREESKTNLLLPEFLGIQITGFNIEDNIIRDGLGIRKYSDLNVLLRYYRQVNIHGDVAQDRISEEQQKELINSLFEINKRKESSTSFANRYQTFLTSKDRENNSLQNNARFSVSTVLLKTNIGKFKPAQLCSVAELDMDFLPKVEDSQLHEFLLFLGVSTEKNYRIVDGPIYSKLSSGMDYCTAPLTKENGDTLTAKLVLPNIQILLPKNKIEHPALINYNKYPFLTDVSNSSIRRQLSPLQVGEYINYPDEFSDILLEKVKTALSNFPEDVFRFYSSNVFHLFLKRNEFLIVNNGKFSWTKEQDFFIAKNRNEFEILKNYPINLLAYFNDTDLTYSLRQKIVKLSIDNVQVTDQKSISTEFKNQFDTLIPFLLIDISKLSSTVSIKDYLKDPQTIHDLQEKWNKLIVVQGTSLKSEMVIEQSDQRIVREDKYQFHNNTLYLRNDVTPSEQAKALAIHFFEISALSDRIELILFHKNLDDLQNEYDKKELDLINSFWLPDYKDKFNHFQHLILEEFGITAEENHDWYIYTEERNNDFLIGLDKENRLNALERKIETVKRKEEFEDYFSSFQLRINRKHIQNKCSELQIFLEERAPDSEKLTLLKQLSMKLGVEEQLSQIESELKEEYPDESREVDIDKIDHRTKELDLELSINRIMENASFPPKPVDSLSLTSHEAKSLTIEKNQNQRVFSANGNGTDVQDLEAFGASGEEEVLIYFINEFLQIKEPDERVKGIEEVYTLLRKKIGNDSHIKYKNDCLRNIDNDVDLQRALIPLFYVTLHHKFAFFDLIVYHEGRATLVEVKTTKNNNKFYISKAEVNAARSEENYLLVRNTARRIELLGNPIKQFEDQFKMIKGDKLSIIPRNYEIILH